MRRNNGIIGPFSNPINRSLGSAKVVDLHDVHTRSLDAEWFKSVKLLSASPTNFTSLLMNQTIDFTLAFEGLDHENTLYFTCVADDEIIYAEGSTANFMTESGTASITHSQPAGQGKRQTITFPITLGYYPNRYGSVGDEPERSFTLQIRTGSITGPIIYEVVYPIRTLELNYSMFFRYLDNPKVNYTTVNEIGNTISGNDDLYGLRWNSQYTENDVSRSSFVTFNTTTNPYTSGTYSQALFLRGGTGSASSRWYLRKPLNTPNDMGGTPKILDFINRQWSPTFQYNLQFSVPTADRHPDDYIKIFTGTSPSNINVLQAEIYGSDAGNSLSGSFSVTNTYYKYIRIQFETHDPTKDVDIIGTYLYQSGAVNFGNAADSNDLINNQASVVTTIAGLNNTNYDDLFYVADDLVTESTTSSILSMNVYLISGQAGTSTAPAQGQGSVHHLTEVMVRINDTSQTPNITITQPSTTISEGDTLTFTITDSANTGQANTYYWTIKHGTTNISDFYTSSGNFISSSGVGTVTVESLSDTLSSESDETFQIEIRRGSTTGTVVATSDVITLTNVNPTILNNVIAVPNINIVTSTSNDTTRAFDVFEVIVPSILSNSMRRIYLGTKINGSTTYYHDICVGGVQILTAAGSVQSTFNFSDSTDVADWNTRTATTTAGSNRTTVIGGSWAAFASANTSRFSPTSSTGSNNTGASDGISSTISTAYPVGIAQIAQSSVTNYLYREASGSTRYSTAWMRTTSSHQFNTGSKIRVAYHYDTNSGQQTTVDPDDTFFIFLD